MYRKGFINILIVLVIALALGAAGYFAVVKDKKTVPSQSQNIATSTLATTATSTTDVSTWKTYKNEKYGFEFKYPNDYLVSNTIDYRDVGDLHKQDIDPKYAEKNNLDFYATFGFPENAGHYQFSIEGTSYASLNDWYKDWKKEVETPAGYEGVAEINNKVVSTEDITIQGVSAKKIWLNGSFPSWNAYFAMIKNGKIYMFGYDGWLRDAERKTIDHIWEITPSEIRIKTAEAQTKKFQEYHRDVFSKILSTFKFITPVDILSWKTYRNEKYGIEVKYPNGSYYVSDQTDEVRPYVQVRDSEREDMKQPPGITFSLPIDSDKKYSSINDFVLQYQKDNSNDIIKKNYFNLNTIPAVEIYKRDDYYGDYRNIYLLRNGLVYTIGRNSTLYLDEGNEIWNQIVATFKFINNTSIP